MQNPAKVFLSFLIGLSIPFSGAYVPDVSAASAKTITVDLSSNIKESTPLLLGINTDWHSSGSVPYLQNSHSLKPSNEFVDFFGRYGLPLENFRQGGDSSNVFDWTAALGAPSERRDSAYAKNYGITEWIKTAQTVNPDTALTYVINIEDPVEKTANLIRFLTLNPNDTGATEPATGINWAQRRVDLGIAAPPNIIAFELGNEKYSSYGVSSWSSVSEANVISYANDYVNKCKPVIDAVRAVNPNVKLSVVSNSGAEVASTSDAADTLNPTKLRVKWWNKTVIEALRDYNGGINYVTHHDYYRDNDENYTARSANIYKRISDYFGGYDIKIMVTEHNLLDLLSSSATTEERLNRATELSTLKRALYIGEFLNTAYNHPLIYSANHHGLWGTTDMWAVARTFESDGNTYLTAPGSVLALMSEAVGGTVKETAVSNNSDNSIITSAHMKEDGRLDLVIMSRKNNSSEEININIQNGNTQYRLESVSILTGDSDDCKNTPETPEGAVGRRALVNAETPITSYTVPQRSMSVLHLVPSETPQLNDTVGQITSQQLNGSLRITDKLYHQDGLRNTPISVLLLKPETDPENYTCEDIVSAGQTSVCADIAYCEIPLPSSLSDGEYIIKVGSKKFTHSAAVHLNSEQFGTVNIDITNAADTPFSSGEKEYDNVVNTDYRIEAAVTSDIPICSDASLGITVAYGDSETIERYTDADSARVAYIGETAVNSAGNIIAFNMPRDSISGLYTMQINTTVGSKTFQGSKTFYFSKPDERITIVAPPRNENGKEVKLEFDTPPKKIYVPIKRTNSDTVTINVFATFYDNNNRLLHASSNHITLSDDNVHTVEIDCSAKTAASIKIFIWDIDSMHPQSHTYYIR